MPAETAQPVRNTEVPSAEFIFGSTAGMREIREKIDRAVRDDLPVLIEGENGTGKEVIGRFVHSCSVRKEGPFLKLNCAAGPANLLEGEIYGYEKGEARQAWETSARVGLASGGTLFFDEIGEMDLTLQQKLTDTLGSGRYQHVDGSTNLAVNARFMCSSSTGVETRPGSQSFPEQLVKLFAHHHLRLPPLRERKQDIPQLCEYLLEKFARDFGRPVPRLSSNVLEAFQQWKWPGNIRELENWIARIVIFGAEEVMGLQFSRQLVAWEEPTLGTHHAARAEIGRTTRLRRHR
jgi:DNA-binding NtrC family response regulator